MRTLVSYWRYFTQIRQPFRVQHRFQSREMTMSSPSIPQIRSVTELGVEGPAFKKQRLEANNESDTRAIEVEEEIAVRMDSSSANSISKPRKSKKKRKDPPLPEPCSAADVLYQEIRTLLGEGAVDRITQDGGAFKSPYSYGEEIVVEIQVSGSGGASFSSLLASSRSICVLKVLGLPWAQTIKVHGRLWSPLRSWEKPCGLKSLKTIECARTVNYWRSLSQTRS